MSIFFSWELKLLSFMVAKTRKKESTTLHPFKSEWCGETGTTTITFINENQTETTLFDLKHLLQEATATTTTVCSWDITYDSLSHKQNPRIKLGFPETLFVPSDRFLADLSRPDRDWDLARDRAVNRGRSSKTIPFPGSSEEQEEAYPAKTYTTCCI
ncbi:hypothetical protein OPV22_013549 [Ensete ventricosum]|uniref:Uncharacterized protein n=1 Tax=Ensete ventricosum TaxID=4639 RepID=A0AAV8PIR3_ENSVE|nr:hypothetical protein OPV22_013549 [Ensete ventricosum]